MDAVGVADGRQHKQNAQAEAVQRYIRPYAEAGVDPLAFRIGAGDKAPVEKLQHPAQYRADEKQICQCQKQIHRFPPSKVRSAACTTWRISTVEVTAPTPPGTGVMASTMDAAASKSASPTMVFFSASQLADTSMIV